MNCPYCGAPMEVGVLNTKSPVFWSECASGLPIPIHRGDVILGDAAGFLRPKAWLCRDCHIYFASAAALTRMPTPATFKISPISNFSTSFFTTKAPSNHLGLII